MKPNTLGQNYSMSYEEARKLSRPVIITRASTKGYYDDTGEHKHVQLTVGMHMDYLLTVGTKAYLSSEATQGHVITVPLSSCEFLPRGDALSRVKS